MFFFGLIMAAFIASFIAKNASEARHECPWMVLGSLLSLDTFSADRAGVSRSAEVMLT
jgi:hypothetical protein